MHSNPPTHPSPPPSEMRGSLGVGHRYPRLLQSSGACVFSMLVHAIGLIVLGLLVVPAALSPRVEQLEVVMPEEPPPEFVEVLLEEELRPADHFSLAAQSSSLEAGIQGLAQNAAPAQMDRKLQEQLHDAPQVRIESSTLTVPSSRRLLEAVPDGTFGNPRAVVDDYDQAFDQITQEILWMLEKNKVLVIWCFDQSESMQDDQAEIRQRIRRVYQELGLTTSVRGDALASAVTSYGAGFRNHTPKPTSDLLTIDQAISQVPIDPSGNEYMCLAVSRSITEFRDIAKSQKRQMALVLVTDESGDAESNNRYLEAAVAEAKAASCRIYVLGREAVFGYPYAFIRWIHPHSKRPHWLRIDRGPETGFVEQLQINGFRRRHDAFPSGFGSYEQARLAKETNGVFFLLPSLESSLVRGEKRRYELQAMRSYRPDLRARIEVLRDRDQHPLRTLIWTVVHELNPYNPQSAKNLEMRVEFSPQFPVFVQQVLQEQAKAKTLIRFLAEAERAMAEGQKFRAQESQPRWRANYDLIYAQLIAYQARLYEYGVALEHFKRNPPLAPLTKAPNLSLVHWDIATRSRILAEQSRPYIERSRELFLEVIREYAGTPWAGRADWELKRGFGVELVPDYEPPYLAPPGSPEVPIPRL